MSDQQLNKEYTLDGYPVKASLYPKPGDRDRITPPAAKPKTRTVHHAANLYCPDCSYVFEWYAGTDKNPKVMQCANPHCPSHGTKYKVPTIELEIIDESSSVPAQAAPVDPNAGAAPSLGEMFANPQQPMRVWTEVITADITSNREEIIRAFLAKYGCEPDRLEQVVKNTPEGTIWSVQKKQQASAWISVKDRLPEYGVPVIGVWYPANMQLCERAKGAFADYWCETHNTMNHLCAPTHWMPLPDPPKETP